MAKQVTRTIISYKYTLMKTATEGGTLKVIDAQAFAFPERMGDRKLKTWIKEEHPELTGYVVGGVEEVKQTYAMALDFFLANAAIVDEPAAENK